MRVEGAGSDWSALRDGTTTRSNGRVERESEHLKKFASSDDRIGALLAAWRVTVQGHVAALRLA
jgi:hypothetical protein